MLRMTEHNSALRQQRDEILAAVVERNRINGLTEGPERRSTTYAMWQLWLGQWFERHGAEYVHHHNECDAAILNSKECTCGIRELLRAIKSKGEWVPGMEYEA